MLDVIESLKYKVQIELVLCREFKVIVATNFTTKRNKIVGLNEDLSDV